MGVINDLLKRHRCEIHFESVILIFTVSKVLGLTENFAYVVHHLNFKIQNGCVFIKKYVTVIGD